MIHELLTRLKMSWMVLIKRIKVWATRSKRLKGSSGKKLSATAFRPYNFLDWQGKLPKDIVRKFMLPTIVKRKSDQTMAFIPVIGTIMFVCVVFYVWTWMLGGGNKSKPSVSPATLATLRPTVAVTVTAFPTVTAFYTVTPFPTATALPVVNQGYRIVMFQYSYYDPKLGGVNCGDWNEETGICDSMMATGLDWRNYYGKAAACPLSYPLYTRLEVQSPSRVAGVWLCLDYCPVCEETGLIDFLTDHQDLPWREWVTVHVYPP